MTRINQLSPEFVHYIPENLEQGVIYISHKYATAAHLCCCGCGLEVVTPFNPAKWRLTSKGNSISLYPSIGNWSFPCKSHYWIKENRIVWAKPMSPETISLVKAQDRYDEDALMPPKEGLITKFCKWLSKLF